MLLSTHRLMSGISTFSQGAGPSEPFLYNDNAKSFRVKLNDSMGVVEDYVETIEISIEDSMAAVFGVGVISGLTPSIGTGLNVDYTSGYALIGFTISKSAGSITVPANYNPGYIYMKQDGTFEINDTGTAPSSTESFLYCTFVSTSSNVTEVSIDSRDQEAIMPVKVREITGITGIVTPTTGYRDYEINHGYSIEVPGFIYASSEDVGVESVEVIDLHKSTPTSFWVRVQMGGASGPYDFYDESYYGKVFSIEWVRTGLGYE